MESTTQTKETGILMTPENGCKVFHKMKFQTRRLLNPPLSAPQGSYPAKWFYTKRVRSQKTGMPGLWHSFVDGFGNFREMECPYGKPGDRLWIREAFFAWGLWYRSLNSDGTFSIRFYNATIMDGKKYHYTDNPPKDFTRAKRELGQFAWYKRPALFMPRHASRTTVELTDVWVQRVQEITESDAEMEGVGPLFSPEEINDGHRYYPEFDLNPMPYKNYLYPEHEPVSSCATARDSFRTLFTSINGPEAWNENRHVWALKFRPI